jgi:AAA family ATP:ADP antiporter
MDSLKRFWRSLFDIRRGEYAKTLLMTLYLMLVLFAYYILKAVSRAMFLDKFDIDKLPWLYILIAAIGGVFAYLYTRLAVKSSLRRAVDFTNILCTAVLVLFWWLLRLNQAWTIYAFNIWVSLFSIILVSQGWLVAANVFSTREAKRLYGILGVGSVIGAAFGGQFTAVMVYYTGTRNLLLASAAVVLLSYGACVLAIRAAGASLAGAKAAEEQDDFSFGEIVGAIRRTRHLQVIIAIITITFIVDVLVEFQFSAMAKQSFKGRDLTAFLGNFYGFWLNLVTFVFQLFLTSFVVSRFGVGGTLQIMPVSIALASIAALVFPSLLSSAAARITEASTRYSFNKTGTELLYLPLPLDLRNRTKAFVDVFVDRLARGMGGMILLLLTVFLHLESYHFAFVVLLFSILWIVLSVVAKRQYMATVRQRLESRRFDFEASRISVAGREIIGLLERTVKEGHPRQAAYALGLLADAPDYHVAELAGSLAKSPESEVRAKAFEVLLKLGDGRARDAALADIRFARGGNAGPAVVPAVAYALALDPEPHALGRRLLDHPSTAVQFAAMSALTTSPDVLAKVIDDSRLRVMAESADPRERRLAAMALAKVPGPPSMLPALLIDSDTTVALEAMRTAAVLQQRELIPALIHHLAAPQLRGAAIDALAGFGARIAGTLGDILDDPSVPLPIRRQVPRILTKMHDQRAVDILMRCLRNGDNTVRAAVLKALNKLREASPKLNYEVVEFIQQVHQEAREYFETYVALATLREFNAPQPATSLLIRTLQDRLSQRLERVFRLLGLRYPPRQIYAVYLAVNRRSGEEYTTAVEFLDNVLERELKRILLPLLDEDAVLAQRAHELFHIEKKSAVEALRGMIVSGDPWLSACAIAAAAELQIRDVAGDIRRAAAEGGREVAEVARAAELSLA